MTTSYPQYLWHTGIFTELVHRKAKLSRDVQLTPGIGHGKGKCSFLQNVVTGKIYIRKCQMVSCKRQKIANTTLII